MPHPDPSNSPLPQRAKAPGTMAGPPVPPSPPTRKLCSCRAELFEKYRGYGSTAWACPEHGFDRQIITVPLNEED